jgi:hypothetical protein
LLTDDEKADLYNGGVGIEYPFAAQYLSASVGFFLGSDPQISGGAADANLTAWIAKANGANMHRNAIIGDLAADTDALVADVAARLPALSRRVIAVGNHDIGPDFIANPLYDQALYDARAAVLPATYGMPALYYSFDESICHVIVLSACYGDGDVNTSLRE